MSLLESALEAFAVGDAMGMPVEFMTLDEIKKRFGLIDRLVDTTSSAIHTNLCRGQITDDTEQVLYLIESYYEAGGVSIESTVTGLRRWIIETHAEEKGYVGPSSLKALQRIQKGEDVHQVGTQGTTCGGAMRVLAPALSVKKGDIQALRRAIWSSCIPTHNTNLAVEAAMALGYGFHYAATGATYDEILKSIIHGAKEGRKMGAKKYVGASTGKRIEWVANVIKGIHSAEEVLDFIYHVIGTTMESNEVVPAAVGIFAYAKGDTWLSIKLGSSVGGDTDTIAAIAGTLSCLYSGGHNIPISIVEMVLHTNNLGIQKYAAMLSSLFGDC